MTYHLEHILLTKCCIGEIDQIHSFQQVQDRYLEDGNDKLKLLVLLCGEDDVQLQRAAAGALAMLTAAQKKLAVKITKVVRINKNSCLVHLIHLSHSNLPLT